MGASCSHCRRTVIEIIPDRDTMIQAVDAIVALETALKAGEPLTSEQSKRLRQARRAIRELKRVEHEP